MKLDHTPWQPNRRLIDIMDLPPGVAIKPSASVAKIIASLEASATTADMAITNMVLGVYTYLPDFLPVNFNCRSIIRPLRKGGKS